MFERKETCGHSVTWLGEQCAVLGRAVLLKEKRRSGGRIDVPLAFATLPCLHEQANPEEGGESAVVQMDQSAHIRELFPLRFMFLFDIAKALVPFVMFLVARKLSALLLRIGGKRQMKLLFLARERIQGNMVTLTMAC